MEGDASLERCIQRDYNDLANDKLEIFERNLDAYFVDNIDNDRSDDDDDYSDDDEDNNAITSVSANVTLR